MARDTSIKAYESVKATGVLGERLRWQAPEPVADGEDQLGVG